MSLRLRRKTLSLSVILTICLWLLTPVAKAGETLPKCFGIIPKPLEVRLSGDGSLNINDAFEIGVAADLKDDNPEAYVIEIEPGKIDIHGASEAGCYYGRLTLKKIMDNATDGRLPFARIYDKPRFGYRGAHFDSARHFFPIDSVKTFIDMLALHNINRMHWHLTDDQGWRIEIKTHPELTLRGSYCPISFLKNEGGEYAGTRINGYYTQDELRDIVKYAKANNIEIIPEVDLPGHFLAALTAYPDLSCSGEPSDVLCAGNPATEAFLKDVFTEVTDIFPSEYIHIGGDECDRSKWKNCAKCQALADSLGLKDDDKGTREAKIQNYLMHLVSDFLRTKGRRVICWDEVLDSEFDPEGIVMAWNNQTKGLEAAKRGHDVIMTPTSHLYFDYYQAADRGTEPKGAGGYIPIEKVYAFEPVPEGLDSVEARHILGPQANLWTEWIPTLRQAQYMELPRLAALSEVQWCGSDSRDFKDFVKRLPSMTAIYNRKGWRWCDHVYDVHGRLEPSADGKDVTLKLDTYDDAEIRYTLDGSKPDENSPEYSSPIVLKGQTPVKAAAFREGKVGRIYEAPFLFSNATLKPVTINPLPSKSFAGKGPQTLTDGAMGSDSFGDGAWLGFQVPEVTVTVDLLEPQEVSRVTFRNNIYTYSWLFDPKSVDVETSTDGKDFRRVAGIEIPMLKEHTIKIAKHEIGFDKTKARYVRLRFKTVDKMPSWHLGAGYPSFIFIDEIGIY